ncbi:MAG: hypothetical protein IJZ64_00840 [Ruminococcus sp.]|nr:hypothetical protein [Ruminococcus sp.]
MNRKIEFYEFGIMFLMGCFVYSLMEILARGFTHWTMTLTGGIVGILLYWLNCTSPKGTWLLQAVTGAFMITAIEMSVGIVDNLIFKWNVWDYGDMPFNLYGQICLPFSFLWFLVCIPAQWICRGVRHRFNFDIDDNYYSSTIYYNIPLNE